MWWLGQFLKNGTEVSGWLRLWFTELSGQTELSIILISVLEPRRFSTSKIKAKLEPLPNVKHKKCPIKFKPYLFSNINLRFIPLLKIKCQSWIKTLKKCCCESKILSNCLGNDSEEQDVTNNQESSIFLLSRFSLAINLIFLNFT